MSVPLACQGRPEAPWTAQTSRQYPRRTLRRAARPDTASHTVLVPFDDSHNTLSLHPHSLLNVSFRGSLKGLTYNSSVLRVYTPSSLTPSRGLLTHSLTLQPRLCAPARASDCMRAPTEICRRCRRTSEVTLSTLVLSAHQR